MSDMCASCKKRFGLFLQANTLCDGKLELCDECFKKIKLPYVEFSNSQKDVSRTGLKDKGQALLKSINELSLDDDLAVQIERWIDASITESEERQRQQEAIATLSAEQEADLRERRNKFIVTTTPTIDGYRIKKYLGIVSGEAALGTGIVSELFASIADSFGTNSLMFSNKVNAAKNEALEIMIHSALMKGATAVVGVNLDLEVTNANMFIAGANGTAVIVEAND